MRRVVLLGGVIVMVASGAVIALTIGTADAIGCTETWANPGSSGVWDDPDVPNHLEAQWASGNVPNFEDNVCLPAGNYTVTMLAGADVADLQIGEPGGGAQPTLAVTGKNQFDQPQLRLGGANGGENYGTLQLGHPSLQTNASVQMSPGTFHNYGTIDMITGGGGDRGLFGNPSGMWMNHGTIHSAAPGYLGCTTFESDGDIDIDPGAKIDWGNCGQVHIDLTGGSVTNDGLFVAPSSLDVTGDTVMTGNPVRVSSGPIHFADDPSGRVQVQGNEISGTIPPDIEIIVDSPADSFNAVLTATGPTTNQGKITLNSADSGGAQLGFPNTTFTNEGDIELLTGGGGFRSLHGNPGGTLVNTATGTIHSSTAAGSWGCATIQSSGTIDVDPGAAMDWGNCGQVHIDLTGGSVVNDGLFVAPSSLDVTGNTAITGANPIRVSSGPLGFGGTPTGDIQAWSSSVAGTIPPGIEIIVDNPGADFGGNLAVDGATTNEGTITLTSVGNNGGSNLAIGSTTLINNGTIEMAQGTSGGRSFNGGTLENHGMLHSGSDSATYGCTTLVNGAGGTVDVDAGKTLTWSGCGGNRFTATGGTVVNDGTMTANGDLVVGGDASFTGTSLVRLDSGVLNFNAGSTATGPIQVGGGLDLASGSTIPADIVVRVDNPIEGNTAQLNLAGPATNNGIIELTSVGTQGFSGLNLGSQTLTNNGSIQILEGAGGGRALQGGTLVNDGLLTVTSTSASNGCNTTTVGTNGAIDIQPGASMMTTCGGQTINVDDGVLHLFGTLQATLNLHGGQFSGAGTLLGPVTNDGALVVPGASPGVLTIDGSYAQSADGVLEVEIGGPTVGTEYDRLAVTGAVTLGGTLRVLPTVVPTFLPEVVTGATVTGTFDNVDEIPDTWVTVNPTAVQIAAVATFPDVPFTHPFFLDIEWASAEDIVNGFADGTFKPSRNAARQALVAMLYRMSGSPLGPDPTCDDAPFPDVPVASDFCGEIAWAADNGIVNGFDDGTFRPGNVITRQALMAIIYRMAGSPLGETPLCASAPFPDVPTTHPFCGEISWAKDEGLATGFPGGNFRPGNNVTRQALAAFLHRSVDFIA